MSSPAGSEPPKKPLDTVNNLDDRVDDVAQPRLKYKFEQYFGTIPQDCPVSEFARFFNQADSQIYRTKTLTAYRQSRTNGNTARLARHLWHTRNNHINLASTAQVTSTSSAPHPTPTSTIPVRMDDEKVKKQPIIKKGTAKAVMKGGMRKSASKKPAVKSDKQDLDKNNPVIHSVKKDLVKTAVAKKKLTKEATKKESTKNQPTKKDLVKKDAAMENDTMKDVTMKDAGNDHDHDHDHAHAHGHVSGGGSDPSNSDDSEDGDDDDDGSDGSEDSDDGKVYCDCKGPDDHSVMISCDGCQQWFHARCYDIIQSDAENLLILFHCKTCKAKNPALKTRFKHLCLYNRLHEDHGYPECRKPVRRMVDGFPFDSDYCSREHSREYIKFHYNRLPDTNEPSRGGVISKKEFALMIHWAGGSAEKFKSLGKNRPTIEVPADFDYKTILTEEEIEVLDTIQHERALILAREKIYDDKLQLLSWIIKKARKIMQGEYDIHTTGSCGYSTLLSLNEQEFYLWQKTDEGIKIFQDKDILDMSTFCTLKHCKKHKDWCAIEEQQMVKDVDEMKAALAEMDAQENAMKEWAKSRQAMAEHKK